MKASEGGDSEGGDTKDSKKKVQKKVKEPRLGGASVGNQFMKVVFPLYESTIANNEESDISVGSTSIDEQTVLNFGLKVMEFGANIVEDFEKRSHCMTLRRKKMRKNQN